MKNKMYVLVFLFVFANFVKAELANKSKNGLINIPAVYIWSINKEEPEYLKPFSIKSQMIQGCHSKPDAETVSKLISGTLAFSLTWRHIENIQNCVILLRDGEEISPRLSFYGFRSVDDEYDYRVSDIITNLKKDAIIVHCIPLLDNNSLHGTKFGSESVKKEMREGSYTLYIIDLCFIGKDRSSISGKTINGYYDLVPNSSSLRDRYVFGFKLIDGEWVIDEIDFHPDQRIMKEKEKYNALLLSAKRIIKGAFDEDASWEKSKESLMRSKSEVEAVLYNKSIPKSPDSKDLIDISDQ